MGGVGGLFWLGSLLCSDFLTAHSSVTSVTDFQGHSTVLCEWVFSQPIRKVMKRNWFILLLLVGSLACSTASQHGEVDAKTFSDLLAQTPHKTLLDVRTADETAQGMIPGAIQIDYYDPQFRAKINQLDRNNPVFVYCAVGGRSTGAAQQLTQAGFKTIYNLSGGLQTWQQAGFGVAKKMP